MKRIGCAWWFAIVVGVPLALWLYFYDRRILSGLEGFGGWVPVVLVGMVVVVAVILRLRLEVDTWSWFADDVRRNRWSLLLIPLGAGWGLLIAWLNFDVRSPLLAGAALLGGFFVIGVACYAGYKRDTRGL